MHDPSPRSRPRRSRLRLGVLLTILGVAATACSREDASAPPDADPVASEPTAAEIGPVQATINTGSGSFRIELRPDAAPVACANFINLVQRGFYDGLEFYRHSRVIRQVGNPWNDEETRWNCGYQFMPEFSPDLRFDRGGMVALTRIVDDPTSPVRPNEFFVTTKPQSERYTFTYPIFAVVVEGQEVVNAMPKGDRIESIELTGDPAPLLAPYADAIEVWNQALDRAADPRRTTP